MLSAGRGAQVKKIQQLKETRFSKGRRSRRKREEQRRESRRAARGQRPHAAARKTKERAGRRTATVLGEPAYCGPEYVKYHTYTSYRIGLHMVTSPVQKTHKN